MRRWTKINDDQLVSEDGRYLLNAAEWWDDQLDATRHGWTLTGDDGKSLGLFETLAEAKEAAD